LYSGQCTSALTYYSVVLMREISFESSPGLVPNLCLKCEKSPRLFMYVFALFAGLHLSVFLNTQCWRTTLFSSV